MLVRSIAFSTSIFFGTYVYCYIVYKSLDGFTLNWLKLLWFGWSSEPVCLVLSKTKHFLRSDLSTVYLLYIYINRVRGICSQVRLGGLDLSIIVAIVP